MRTSDSSPSITAFRERVRSLLRREGGAAQRRDVVIFAVDGIPYELALAAWPHAEVSPMRSVFPTTSSSAWLSSLTGAEVELHGVPGVVFKSPGGDVINVFEYKGSLDLPATGNIFSDAAALGYLPVSVVGDWEPYDCAWRDALLSHSQPLTGYRFYTAPPPREPGQLSRRALRAVSECIDAPHPRLPALVWCFIDADQHIHHHGYDEELVSFLGLVDEVAVELTRRGVVVVAHSDHGLVPTNHNLDVVRLLEETQAQYDCVLGGAGRTRWLYTRLATEDSVAAALEHSLPSSVRVRPADEVFGAGSLARARVGGIVLIADGDEFMTFSGQRFDHGSSTEAELNVPYARWSP